MKDSSQKTVLTAVLLLIIAGFIGGTIIMNQHILKGLKDASPSGTMPSVAQSQGAQAPASSKKEIPNMLLIDSQVQSETMPDSLQSDEEKKPKAIYEKPLSDVILVQ